MYQVNDSDESVNVYYQFSLSYGVRRCNYRTWTHHISKGVLEVPVRPLQLPIPSGGFSHPSSPLQRQTSLGINPVGYELRSQNSPPQNLIVSVWRLKKILQFLDLKQFRG